MCLIAYRPAEEPDIPAGHIPAKVIEHNRQQNPDGFGIAWRRGGGLAYEKFGPDDFGKFRKVLERADRDPATEYVAHFRLATHGAHVRDLAHPFEYRDKKAGRVLVFHNGILDITGIPKGESDTSWFVKSVMAGLPPLWWRNRSIFRLVEDRLGWSRMVLMTRKETVILNDEIFEEQGGLMYSCSPLPRPVDIAIPKLLPAGQSKPVAQTVYDFGHVVQVLDKYEDKWGGWGNAHCVTCGKDGMYFIYEGAKHFDMHYERGFDS